MRRRGIRYGAAARRARPARGAALTSTQSRQPTVDLVYFNAGGGHRAAAEALRDVVAAQRRPWRMRLVNLVDVLDPKSSFRRLTGVQPEDLYNIRLKRGWTRGLEQELRLLQTGIRLAHSVLVRTLATYWTRTHPDLVVSLIPNFNRALGVSVAQALPGTPFATVMTDLADFPPRFWAEPAIDQHLVCGTAAAAAQARAAGVPAERISTVSGMILRPAFHAPARTGRASGRVALGLDPGRPTGIVMFGGHGSVQMLKVAAALPRTQLLFLCGHNAGLLGDLKALRRAAPHAAVGYTRDVADLLRLGDFFVGKPGPGSISEALHVGLPVVTFDNAWTMPQERYNVRWLHENGCGLAVPSTAALGAAVDALLVRLDACRARVAALDNRAVFEVVALLERLLAPATERSLH